MGEAGGGEVEEGVDPWGLVRAGSSGWILGGGG